MKDKIFIVTGAVAGAAIFAVLLFSLFLRSNFGFLKADFDVVYELDTHGGFHNDGEYYLILDCSKNRKEALDNIKNWKALPLPENLENAFFGSLGGSKIAEELNMPKIGNGAYIFRDRLDGKNDDLNIGEGPYNFSVAVYDSDNDIMYYYELDT